MSLELSSPSAQATDTKSEMSLAAMLAVTVFVSSLIFFVLFGALGWLMFDRPADGLAIGLFSAFWGGPGFGAIATGVLWKGEDHEDPSAVEQPSTSTATEHGTKVRSHRLGIMAGVGTRAG